MNKRRRVLVLQHTGCETLGTIADALDTAGVTAHYIRSFAGQPVPKQLGDDAGLIVMGGPQSVYEQDKFPFLRDELRLIEDALQHKKAVLGTCLGSQLLAATLGAKVKAGPQKEIGWFDITQTAIDPALTGIPKSFVGFHWHGDIFDLPAGAVALASSALTTHQAYWYGSNAYGFLFHMEVTAAQIAEMITLFAEELHAAGGDARALLFGTKKHLPALQKIGSSVYGAWTKLLV